MISYLIAFVCAMVIGFGMTSLSIRFSKRFNLLDYPTRRKQHPSPMPNLGGASIFIGFWAVFAFIASRSSTIQLELSNNLLAIFAASSVVFLTGLIDDRRPLKVYHKVLGQLLAAVIVMAAGFTIPRFYVPFWGSIELGWTTYIVTTFWIVVLSNSINLIDGMDGLAGSVSIIVCFGMLVTGILLGVETVVAVTVCLAGSVAGFLLLNRPPAKVFMGDSGSLFLGFMFSLLAVICPIKSYTAVAMFVPLVAVGLPLIEVAATLVRRTVSGQRFYVADNRHIYNYLKDFGLSDKNTLLVLSVVSLVFTAFVPALFWFDRMRVFSIFVTFILILFVSFFVLKLKRSQGR